MRTQIQIAMEHHAVGRLGEAEKIYRQLLSHNPNDPDALHLLGVIASQVGRSDAGMQLIERAISLRPGVGPYHENLGNACLQLGLFPRARVAFLKAVELSPGSHTAFFHLGNFHRDIGENDLAEAAYRDALQIKPDYGQAMNNLGLLLQALGRMDEAIAALKRADEILPDSPEVNTGLALAYFESGMQAEARVLFDRVVELDPKNLFRASNRVYASHFDPASTPPSLLKAARQWDEAHGNPPGSANLVYAGERAAERKLRVGYVSADLRDHVVGHHIQPLFTRHDRQGIEIFVYSNGREDAVSRLLARHCVAWRNISPSTDAQAAAIIRADKIDVLVDLALHSEGNRLGVFTRRPAPVQISFFGYCSTTGLNAMGWRISDPWIESLEAGAAGPRELEIRQIPDYTERTIVLPHTHLCYQAPLYTPDVNEPPAISAGHLTFGCLNNYSKVTPEALEVWARILADVPRSRLILHSKMGHHRGVARQVFQRLGVSPDRLEFVPRLGRRQYFAAYSQIDITLDPFPYGGGITTCDSLWMGVPVINLRGRTAVGRVATSILGNAGLDQFSTSSIDAYKARAIEVASDLTRLAETRRTLRGRLQASPTMDAAGYARDIEKAYRLAWREFCSNASA